MYVIVLGIDPGVANTGYGVVAQHRGRMLALDGGVVETAPGLDAGRRLATIHERVGALLDEHRPDALALEDLYFGANAHSAFAVGQARGVVMLAAGQRGVPTASYTPQQVKSAVCGNGRAAKDQVQRMVQTLLALTELPRPDHAADALAVAICHANGAPLQRGAGRMIALLDGTVAVRRADHVVVSCGGVGYRLAVSAETLRHVPRVGTATELHTHLIVRDDALQLYGFATEEERDLFLLLIGVQSVGPKMALAVLSGGPPRELLTAVAAGDTGAAPGRARHRQAHRRADRGRAAREGRREPIVIRRARRRPADARARRPGRPRVLARRRPTSCSTARPATRPRT